MKIALIGYGKMGKLIEEIALQNEHQIVAKIDPKLPTKEITEETVRDADVCIDFSHPKSVLGNIQKLATLGKNVVVGTTGWYDQIETVKHLVVTYKIGLLYAPNFSIGINIMLKVLKEAASLINHFDEFDIGGFEAHHNQKADSPSGTAKAIASVLVDSIERKDRVIYDLIDNPVPFNHIHFPSLRCGHNPGTHTVIFDSPSETITITHQARNREGFASGAVTAAEWLYGKAGFFTIQDLIGSIKT